MDFVKKELENAESGHDWWHIRRVYNMAKHIAKKENYDNVAVDLGALLHDIADAKFHNGDEEIGSQRAAAFLQSQNVKKPLIQEVGNIVKHISFKGGNHQVSYSSRALEIVQDADRLDAIGAIGIARAFSYGGYKNRKIYDPEIRPQLGMSKEEYRKNKAPTINHFYEKLLLLKDKMNTASAKEIAEQRHQFMQQFLTQFYAEWELV